MSLSTRTSFVALALSLMTFVLTSCREQGVALSIEEERRADSLALTVAVMPVEDCLPVYLIEALSLDDSCGLDLRLLPHASLMDIDTTYERSHAILAYEDSLRLLHYSGEDTLWMRTPHEMALLTTKERKITKLKQLMESKIAVARWSAVDSFASSVINSSSVDPLDIYRPQINDVRLRYRMLQDGLVDGAILPQPYISWAKSQGHRVLMRSRCEDYRVGFYIKKYNLDTHRQRQLHKFDSLYNVARHMLQTYQLDSLQVFSL